MLRFLTILLIALLATTSVIVLQTKTNTNKQASSISDETEESLDANTDEEQKIGGSFTLINQDGASTSDTDFRGKIMLLYFGFTKCTDICPITTANISAALGLLGKQADSVAPVFISVDPDRDTQQTIKTYLQPFDKRITGLTGNHEQIKGIAAAYKAYYSIGSEHEHHNQQHHANSASTEKTVVNHSGFIYLMDKNGVYVRHFPYDANAQELANAVLEQLKKQGL